VPVKPGEETEPMLSGQELSTLLRRSGNLRAARLAARHVALLDHVHREPALRELVSHGQPRNAAPQDDDTRQDLNNIRVQAQKPAPTPTQPLPLLLLGRTDGGFCRQDARSAKASPRVFGVGSRRNVGDTGLTKTYKRAASRFNRLPGRAATFSTTYSPQRLRARSARPWTTRYDPPCARPVAGPKKR
jgi:hypothetical protein